ncbi:unnamed protein product [Paramecium sonneborni]|uniref:Uncharacterized protein n=1 Tax=Paramecium sonneborni TaxID=65129 RepID=A0A8S1RM17_9CILI|nr:unnamed protein product [Paramecium sonneborni]
MLLIQPYILCIESFQKILDALKTRLSQILDCLLFLSKDWINYSIQFFWRIRFVNLKQKINYRFKNNYRKDQQNSPGLQAQNHPKIGQICQIII